MKTLKFAGLLLWLILSMLFAGSSEESGKMKSKTVEIGKPIPGWIVREGGEGKNLWTIGKATLDPTDSTKFVVLPDGDELVNAGHGGVDIMTEKKYGDVHVELEFMIPVDGNSGVYPNGEHEVQIWDSFSKPIILGNQWMGTIVATAEPTVHPEKGGGEWQQLIIDFRAPRFDATGGKIANAKFVKVVLNGVVIHENVEVPAPTPVGLTGKESKEGPLMLQGFAGPVSYRNIKIVPVKAKQR